MDCVAAGAFARDWWDQKDVDVEREADPKIARLMRPAGQAALRQPGRLSPRADRYAGKPRSKELALRNQGRSRRRR